MQGGGPQGTRADETDPSVVFQRHMDASNQIDPGRDLDLVIWPEDVVDVATLSGSAEDRQLRNLARRLHTTLIVGVVEDEGTDAFHNWAVVYGPAGDEIDRYEKVERVPFGEWVPMRSIIEPLSGGSVPDRDALIGQEPAVVHTEHGTLGVMISWEVFFGERARDATTHGAEVLINPTNGSSFEGTQVQTQQVASSRMRAIENGRWVTQVAPTGFTAVVTPEGEVLQRTGVSEQRVLYDTIGLRTGETIYARLGDDLALVYAAIVLGARLGARPALGRGQRRALRRRHGVGGSIGLQGRLEQTESSQPGQAVDPTVDPVGHGPPVRPTEQRRHQVTGLLFGHGLRTHRVPQGAQGEARGALCCTVRQLLDRGLAVEVDVAPLLLHDPAEQLARVRDDRPRRPVGRSRPESSTR